MGTQGNKTSEFQLAVVNILASLIMLGLGKISAEMAISIMAGISGLYIVARVITKFTKTTKDDEILNVAGQVIDKVKEKQALPK